jgi:zinc transporter 1/2/3
MNEKRNQHIDSQVANKVLMTTDSLSAAVVDIEDLASCANALAGSSCRMAGTGECCNDPPQTSKDWSQKEKHIVITMKVDNKPVEQDVASSIGDIDAHTHGGHHHATRSIILILALSLHRIFEGMSIGLQTNLTSVASLFGAVMCHETVIGFSLGLQFVKSDFGLRRLLITSFVCSSIMPVGVLIGLIMTETGSDASSIEIANGVLQAIAMGTFIYVTFFEILQEEVNPEDTSICKIVCIAAGFVMMALLDLIPEEQTTDALLSTHVKMINLTTAEQTIFT